MKDQETSRDLLKTPYMEIIMFFNKKKYKVKLKGRSKLEYTDGDKKLYFSTELMAGSNGIVIYSDSFEKEKLSTQERIKIKNNITEDLKKHNILTQWE